MYSFYGGRDGASFTFYKVYNSVEEMLNDTKNVYQGQYVLINSDNSYLDTDRGNVYQRDFSTVYSQLKKNENGWKYIGNFAGSPGFNAIAFVVDKASELPADATIGILAYVKEEDYLYIKTPNGWTFYKKYNGQLIVGRDDDESSADVLDGGYKFKIDDDGAVRSIYQKNQGTYRKIADIGASAQNVIYYDSETVTTNVQDKIEDVETSLHKNEEDLLSLSDRVSILENKTDYTFVVNSDDDLEAWAENKEGNDYTYVYVNNNNNNIEYGFYCPQIIDLGATKTKIVSGAPGARITFVIGDTGNGYIRGHGGLERINNLIVNIGYMSPCGFLNCNNLINCKVTSGYINDSTVKKESSSDNSGFKECNNLINCKAYGCKVGYESCSNILNCFAEICYTGYSKCNMLNKCNIERFHHDGSGYVYCQELIQCSASGNILDWGGREVDTYLFFDYCDGMMQCYANSMGGYPSRYLQYCTRVIGCNFAGNSSNAKSYYCSASGYTSGGKYLSIENVSNGFNKM